MEVSPQSVLVLGRSVGFERTAVVQRESHSECLRRSHRRCAIKPRSVSVDCRVAPHIAGLRFGGALCQQFEHRLGPRRRISLAVREASFLRRENARGGVSEDDVFCS